MRKRVPSHHLIPKKVPVKGKTPYIAVRWVALGPAETKKEIKGWVRTRKRRTSAVRYLQKHPLSVEIIPKSELERVIEPNKAGKRYFSKKEVEKIKFVMEMKNPSEANGITRIIHMESGGNYIQHVDEWTQKRKRTKFKRSAKIKMGGLREYYKSLLKRPGADKKRQLGAVLALMSGECHDPPKNVRVGSGIGGVEESVIKVADLKRGMVVSHTGWKPGTLPHVVVEEKDIHGMKHIFLRSIDKKEEGKELGRYRSKVKTLEKQLLKDPRNIDKKLELETFQNKATKLANEINISIPPKWTEVTRLGHYGACQIEARHVKFPAPNEVWLDFIGKSGERWNLKIIDHDLAEAIKDCQRGKSGNDQIFPEVDRNEAARKAKKYGIATPKDIRTYTGTKVYVEEWKRHTTPTTKKELREMKKDVYTLVSQKLGNLPGTAKGSYVDQTVAVALEAGVLEKMNLKKSMLYIVMEAI